MKHVVEHDLDPATAKRATEKAWESYQQRFAKYSPRADWRSETHADVSFSVKGVSLKGTIDLEPGGVALDLDVPFLFRPFRGKAIGVIEREILLWIAKAKAGEF
ncbi:MAG: polyhydroxyalkanoic acid system family protein [Myxococcales bacterium]|nr:polyhydroxyalkanoic acid system family protein [Myxococcales bacterium]